MYTPSNWEEWIVGTLLILSALGVITVKNPVHASLSFLLTLILLAGLYMELAASFVAVMQILVYAGAILVIFIFVIVLFQDAHQQLGRYKPKSSILLITTAIASLLAVLGLWGSKLVGIQAKEHLVKSDFGTVESMGSLLYTVFFFPFEAVILLFLVSLIGAVYIGRKER